MTVVGSTQAAPAQSPDQLLVLPRYIRVAQHVENMITVVEDAGVKKTQVEQTVKEWVVGQSIPGVEGTTVHAIFRMDNGDARIYITSAADPAHGGRITIPARNISFFSEAMNIELFGKEIQDDDMRWRVREGDQLGYEDEEEAEGAENGAGPEPHVNGQAPIAAVGQG